MPFPVCLPRQAHKKRTISRKSYTICGGKGMPFPYMALHASPRQTGIYLTASTMHEKEGPKPLLRRSDHLLCLAFKVSTLASTCFLCSGYQNHSTSASNRNPIAGTSVVISNIPSLTASVWGIFSLAASPL